MRTSTADAAARLLLFDNHGAHAFDLGSSDTALRWLNDTLHLGTGYVLDDLAFEGSATAVEPSRLKPATFALEQNYPNPFNPVSVIPYEVGGSGSGPVMVRISVFDVLGREVAVLVNEPRGPGRYTVPFTGNAFASGVYLCRMDVGGNSLLFRDVKKMLLLR